MYRCYSKKFRHSTANLLKSNEWATSRRSFINFSTCRTFETLYKGKIEAIIEINDVCIRILPKDVDFWNEIIWKVVMLQVHLEGVLLVFLQFETLSRGNLMHFCIYRCYFKKFRRSTVNLLKRSEWATSRMSFTNSYTGGTLQNLYKGNIEVIFGINHVRIRGIPKDLKCRVKSSYKVRIPVHKKEGL